MKFKRINKDDICDFIFDVGCTAFMVPIVSIMFAHDGIKRRYNKIPSVAKKRKRINDDIHKLEKELGLEYRSDECLYYDPHYYKNSGCCRQDYYNALKHKLATGYKSPDIILVIEKVFERHEAYPSIHIKGDIQHPEYSVYIMADKDLYNVPDNAPQTTSRVYCRMATTFTSGPLIPHPITMSECGRYGDYFVVPVPGRYQLHEISVENENIKSFIEEFKRNYKKQ